MSLMEKVTEIQRILLAKVTDGEDADPARYAELRRELLLEPSVRARLPAAVTSCRELDDFWPFITKITGRGGGTWAARCT